MISDSIPFDLNLEILSRLPEKSIARFRCVSKLWASVFHLPYFTELFLTRSSTRPRLLFAIEQEGEWSFFSLPQRQNPYEKSSSLVVAADFHMKFPPDNMRIYMNRRFSCGYAFGLIYFYGMLISEEDYGGVPVICNPNTGRYATLPYLLRYRKSYSFFGFDPIDRLFKVLFMAYPGCSDHHKILTLETGEMRWRKIKCSLIHEILSEGICINGVLYYLGQGHTPDNYVIVCFDVRSEKFKFIYLKSFCVLINYKGRLGVIYYGDYANDAMELRVWVLKDAEKQVWSKYAYTLRDDKSLARYVSVVGVTATGAIILSKDCYTSEKPFYVYYFNPERNTLQRVEISFGANHEAFKNSSVYTFVDHVEDLNVNDPKLLKSSIYAPYVKKTEDFSDYERSESEEENQKENEKEKEMEMEKEKDQKKRIRRRRRR